MKSAAEMRALFAELPEACDSTLAIAERADVNDRVRQRRAARLPAAHRVHHRRRVPPPPHVRGREGPLRRADPHRGWRTARERVGPHQRNGFRALLPCGVGPHSPRSRTRDQGGPGSRLVGRQLCRLLLAYRRPRSVAIRLDLRALLEPGAQVDARHRHGLRRAPPRRAHSVRGRALRVGPRRAGGHLLHDQGAGRSAGRGARTWATRTKSAIASPRRCHPW